jgi:hypothetical protein
METADETPRGGTGEPDDVHDYTFARSFKPRESDPSDVSFI